MCLLCVRARRIEGYTIVKPLSFLHARYWTRISSEKSLAAALEEIRGSWIVGQGCGPCPRLGSEQATNQHPQGSDREQVTTVSAEKAPHESTPSASRTFGSQSVLKNLPPTDNGEAKVVQGREIQQQRERKVEDSVSTLPAADPLSAVICDRTVGNLHANGFGEQEVQTRKGSSALEMDTVVEVSSLPPRNGGTIKRPKERGGSMLLEVLGFAAEWDSSSRQGCVAVIGEWPGIGSLQDLLEGKTNVQRASQEDLIRWTRQAAQGLIRVCDRDRDGVANSRELSLRISTRNIYLCPRPKDELASPASGEVLDARVRDDKIATVYLVRVTWGTVLSLLAL